MYRSPWLILLFSSLLILGLAACNDDDCPTCPDPVNVTATMDNIWPHADGTVWSYAGEYQEYAMPDPDPDPLKSDTSIPSMALLHGDLQGPLGGIPDLELPIFYRLIRDGEITTESDVTADYLRSEIFVPEDGPFSKDAVRAAHAPDRLLQMIAEARPDLRDAIRPHLKATDKLETYIGPPLFLNGYAFAYEDSGYYGYGDLNTIHAWTFLESSLDVGTEFTLQLVPGLTDDIWLTGQVWSQGALTVNGVTFQNVVEVMYVIDFGEQVLTNESGDILSTLRSYAYGTIHFAPEVGPVLTRERARMIPDPILQESVPFVRDYVLEMVAVSLGD